MIKVKEVVPGSIGEAIGLVPDAELLTVGDTRLDDFLDWEFLTAEEDFTLVYRRPGVPDEFEVSVERTLEEPLGVTVEPARIRRCANRCDFCFVDGNPDGVRDVLYIRDDDYRLSFRYGNFATLTNLKPHDTARIIAYHLSPLYVSVHATDPVVRRWILRNPQAAEIIPQLRELADHGIEFHTQIVLSPGVNDGAALVRTLDDLWNFGPSIRSVSIVPVGLTEFSQHDRVREPTEAECRAAIATVTRSAERALVARDTPWAYGADELYLRAGVELPSEAWYGDFEQVENGVGSVRWLERCIREGAAGIGDWSGRRIAVLTGTSMAPLMPPLLASLARATGASFELVPVTNALFGPRVTTAGLLPGAAIAATLAALEGIDLALIPGEAVNDAGVLIDSLALESLQAGAPMAVRPSKTFVDALLEPLAA